MEARHKKFADELNVVCILKTNLTTKQQAHVLLFSSDLTLDAEKMIDYYSLRFQLCNRVQLPGCKTILGIARFYECQQDTREQCGKLVNVYGICHAKLTDTFRCPNTEFSVLDLKARYRGAKYLHETLNQTLLKQSQHIYSCVWRR